MNLLTDAQKSSSELIFVRVASALNFGFVMVQNVGFSRSTVTNCFSIRLHSMTDRVLDSRATRDHYTSDVNSSTSSERIEVDQVPDLWWKGQKS